jgi:4-hydroxy-tetrahydrodipicolinate synthase
VNVNPRLSIALRDALRNGDSPGALLLLGRIARFEELRAENRSANNVSVVKEALSQLGLCDPFIRPPSSVPDAATRSEIAEILSAWGAVDDLLLPSATPAEAVQL